MVDFDLNTVPTVPLKVVLAVHFVLITWGIQGRWSPDSYLFYNLVFVVSILWALHSKDKEEPLQVAMAIDIYSFAADIFLIGGYFPMSNTFGERFSVSMAILNLVFRPVSVIMMGKVCAERMGLNNGFPVRFGNLFGHPQAQQRGTYEDIESAPHHHQSIPRTDTSGLSPTYH